MGSGIGWLLFGIGGIELPFNYKFALMNWRIRNTSKLKFHTNLTVLLEPIKEDLLGLKWLISDLEINTSVLETLPVNHEKDWFLITSGETAY